jgi:hypothetical protein
MTENVDIKLTTYNREQLTGAINTEFTQFVNNNTPEEIATDNITITGFFEAYARLFLEIPKQGEINSHQFITNQSGEYVGGEDISAEVQALTAEVTQLREDNVLLQQQIMQLADSVDLTDLTNVTTTT